MTFNRDLAEKFIEAALNNRYLIVATDVYEKLRDDGLLDRARRGGLTIQHEPYLAKGTISTVPRANPFSMEPILMNQPPILDPRYQAWIDAFVRAHQGRVTALCVSATAAMEKAFPELTRVAGWVGNHEHVWLVTEDGTIVDPTARQFYTYPDPTHYRPFKPGDTVRTGRCCNCGLEIYRAVQSLDGPKETICSDECRAEYAVYVNTPRST